MLGVTLFGLVFTPIFYVLSRRLASVRAGSSDAGAAPTALTENPAQMPAMGEATEP